MAAKSPLHDFPLTFLKWNTKKAPRCPPPSPSPPPPPPPPTSFPVGARSSRTRRPDVPKPEKKQEPEPEPEPDPEPARNLRPRKKAEGGSTAVVDAADTGEKKDKRKLWIALSKDEIEEDIYAMTGAKPSRRPRKHPKNVQKQLDNLFPGLWLVGFTPDSYRSIDPPPLK